jgi:hypothetical protein
LVDSADSATSLKPFSAEPVIRHNEAQHAAKTYTVN